MSDINIFTQDPGEPQKKWLMLEPKLITRIVSLGLPVIIGMLSQAAINTIDLLMIGRLDEEIAVPGTAAVLSSVVILWAFGGFLSSVSVGTQALTARRFSEGHLKSAGQVLTNSAAISIIFGISVTVIAMSSINFIMSLQTTSKEVFDMGVSYSNVRLLGLLSMALMASFKSFYDAMGRVRVHMYIAIIMNILNAIFDYVLIFGLKTSLFTIDAIGINGAAWGSVISSYIGVFMILIWSLRKNDRIKFGAFSFKQLNTKVFWSISKLSVWSGFATIILMLGVGVFNYIISHVDSLLELGSVSSSASSIIIHIMMLVFMTSIAFGSSLSTLVSQNIGVKNFALAERYVFQCVLLSLYVMGAFGILVFLFPKPILLAFLPADIGGSALKDAVILEALPSLRLCALFLTPISAASLVLLQALYGAGETKFVMIIEFFLHFFCLAPLAYILSVTLSLGLIGCWIAAIVYAFLLLLATLFKFLERRWHKYEL